jgi:hypothetical protein
MAREDAFYFEFAVRHGIREANKAIALAAKPKPEYDPELCIVCQNEPRADLTDVLKDETCGSRACRETWYGEVWERF